MIDAAKPIEMDRIEKLDIPPFDSSSGSGYGNLGEKHQRMLIATSEEIITEALTRVERALKKL